MANEHNQPVKLTITYKDGRTESHEVFVAVVARGLIPAGKADNERVCYVADGECFSVSSVCSIAADAMVVATLLEAMFQIINSIVGTTADNPKAALELLRAMTSFGTKKTIAYENTQVIRRSPNPEEN